ncbi:hypothetical protein [uncultured Leptotrichia sp.]|uniref:hypothetical protein n=1 Tax=uncultured Leptotrichia sp. TaxID=159271 RepID=UPI0025CD4118|nr:hypothetical protein [uncultured Leptotrichia sp.]
MKRFEIQAKIPVTAISTEIYLIEAETEEKALEIFKSGNFDRVKCFIDSYGSDDLEMKDGAFAKADISYIEEV